MEFKSERVHIVGEGPVGFACDVSAANQRFVDRRAAVVYDAVPPAFPEGTKTVGEELRVAAGTPSMSFPTPRVLFVDIARAT